MTSTASSDAPTAVRSMSRPEVPATAHPERGKVLARFDRPVRWVHQLTAALMIVCILSAAVLYNGSIAVVVGHRGLVEQIHVYAGFALPVPPLVGVAFRSYRRDVGRLNRWTARDWAWLRSRSRRDGAIEVGKFNAGQKANAALSAGSIAALLLSGLTMWFTGLASIAWRSGATFVHDWFALALGLLVVGHLVMALRDPLAMTGMWTGRVPLRWARHEHSAWARELAGDPVAPSADPSGPSD